MKKRGILDWFKWESKATQEARAAEYSTRMFRFGEKQKEWEKETIRQLFPKKKDITEIHYDLLTLRETINNATLPVDDEDYEPISKGMADWEKANFSNMRKDGSRKILKAMAYLEEAAKTFEDLPTVEQIKADEELY